MRKLALLGAAALLSVGCAYAEDTTVIHKDAGPGVGRDHQRTDVLRQVQALRRLIEVVIGRLEGLHQMSILAINGPTTAPVRSNPPRS